jgi:nitrite reductase/ring-hydroxylating ferredoxin subunit
MSTDPIHVCPSAALENGGLAVKLDVQYAGNPGGAFFIRYQGQAYGYLNRCPHAGAELDWEGSVFTRAGDRLMCARHGATFEPHTGICNGGPCQPSRLIALKVSEESREGRDTVLWWPEGKITPVD